MIEEGRALFLQIAESVEDSIIDGSLPEEGQAPSTNELAAFYRINPATAAKGVEHARRQGRALQAARHRHVRRAGCTGAPPRASAARPSPTAIVEPLLAEARKLGLGPDDLSRLIRDRAARARDAASTTRKEPTR